MFYNFGQKYGVQQDFWLIWQILYKSIKFFFKYMGHNLKVWSIRNLEVSYFRYVIHSLSLCKHIKHNLESWLIKNGQVPYLDTSLYIMLRFQI